MRHGLRIPVSLRPDNSNSGVLRLCRGLLEQVALGRRRWLWEGDAEVFVGTAGSDTASLGSVQES
jgi:hypothetical protein